MTVHEIRQFRVELLEMLNDPSLPAAPNIETIRNLVTQFTARLESEAGDGAESGPTISGLARGKGDL